MICIIYNGDISIHYLYYTTTSIHLLQTGILFFLFFKMMFLYVLLVYNKWEWLWMMTKTEKKKNCRRIICFGLNSESINSTCEFHELMTIFFCMFFWVICFHYFEFFHSARFINKLTKNFFFPNHFISCLSALHWIHSSLELDVAMRNFNSLINKLSCHSNVFWMLSCFSYFVVIRLVYLFR